jgi:hypothetical protein
MLIPLPGPGEKEDAHVIVKHMIPEHLPHKAILGWECLDCSNRFFRVDESFLAGTRAGLTRARSLSTWVYSERNAVTHLPGHFPL